MNMLDTVGQVLSLFLIMVIGFIMYKKNIIDDEANVRFTRLVLNVTVPAQIITAFVSNQGIVGRGEVVQVFGISLLMYVVYGLMGILFLYGVRVPREQRGTYQFMVMFGNVGFMGFPVVETIFGKEALIYAVIFNVIFNLLVYSIGILMISNLVGGKFDWKKLMNMPLLSSLLSILLFFVGIPLPKTVMDSLNFLGNVTTPVAMLLLGAVIAKMPLRSLFDEWRIYLFTVVKLLFLPAVTWGLFTILPVPSALVRNALLVLSAMPVATNTTMLAIEYKGDIDLASKGIFFTTILSMVTIPLVVSML